MIRTTFGMHNVKSIRVSFSQSPEGTSWMEIVLTDEEGTQHEVTAFVDRPIVIEGAELVALMAQPVPENAS